LGTFSAAAQSGGVKKGHLAQALSSDHGQKVVLNLKNKLLSAVHEIGG